METEAKSRKKQLTQGETGARDSWKIDGGALTKTEKSISDDESQPDKAVTFYEKWKRFPKPALFVIGTEFAERWSMYGEIGYIYYVNIAGFSMANAIALGHARFAITALAAILGAIISDGYLGKYWTITWFALVHVIGTSLRGVAAFFPTTSTVHPVVDVLGVVILGLGAGGMKPCISTFGGDQFKKGQRKELDLFMSLFYWSINLGAPIAVYLRTYIRTRSCFGEQYCYSLALGLPAILMILGLLLFLTGTPWYKRKPPQGNVMGVACKTIWKALVNKVKHNQIKDHWLDHALEGHSCSQKKKCSDSYCQKEQSVKDLKDYFGMLVLMFPLPFIAALYSQLGFGQMIQNMLLDGRVGKAVILPDQMQLFEAVFVLLVIPLSETVIWPAINKIIKITHLRKIIIGNFLIGFTLIYAGALQCFIDKAEGSLPKSKTADIAFINTFPCNITFRNGTSDFFVNSGSVKKLTNLPVGNNQWSMAAPNCSQSTALQQSFLVQLHGATTYYSVIATDGSYRTYKGKTVKTQSADARWTANINNFVTGYENSTIALCKKTSSHECDMGDVLKFYKFELNYTEASKFTDIPMGSWEIHIQTDSGDFTYTGQEFTKNAMGGIYSLTVYGNSTKQKLVSYQLMSDNSISILWQIIPQVLMSFAEISIFLTGIQFTYTEAPMSMKSVVSATYFTSIAIGNVATLILTEANALPVNMVTFFAMAGVMEVVAVIFVILVRNYQSHEHIGESISSQSETSDESGSDIYADDDTTENSQQSETKF